MDQMPLIHEDIYEAVKTTVQALGGSKAVGVVLWPEKSADKAGELLNNCLNTTRPEKLSLDQMLLLIREGRKVGSHAIVDFLANDAGYQFTPIEPRDEVAELQRQFIQARDDMQQLLSRLEKADGRLKAV